MKIIGRAICLPLMRSKACFVTGRRLTNWRAEFPVLPGGLMLFGIRSWSNVENTKTYGAHIGKRCLSGHLRGKADDQYAVLTREPRSTMVKASSLAGTAKPAVRDERSRLYSGTADNDKHKWISRQA